MEIAGYIKIYPIKWVSLVTESDLWASTNRPLFKAEVSLPLKSHLIYRIPVIRSSQCYLHTWAYYGDQGGHKCSAEKATSNPKPAHSFRWNISNCERPAAPSHAVCLSAATPAEGKHSS